MSGQVNIKTSTLLMRRRDGQITGGMVTGSVSVAGSGSGTGSGTVNTLSEVFEVVNAGTENEYLRCKLPFAGDFEVMAWSDQSPVGGGSPNAFRTQEFANPIDLDATIYKDFICGLITGNTTINLNNTRDGDAGMIEVLIDGTGGYTVALGTMFTKQLGETGIDNAAGKDNFISWRMVGTDIVYTIAQIV
jgi:hypothetical protein